MGFEGIRPATYRLQDNDVGFLANFNSWHLFSIHLWTILLLPSLPFRISDQGLRMNQGFRDAHVCRCDDCLDLHRGRLRGRWGWARVELGSTHQVVERSTLRLPLHENLEKAEASHCRPRRSCCRRSFQCQRLDCLSKKKSY